MNKLRAALLGGCAVLAHALPLNAQNDGDFDATFTLGYSTTSIGDVTVGSLSFIGETDIVMTREFGIGLDFGVSSASLDIDGVSEDVDLNLRSLSLEPAYALGGGGFVGGYFATGTLEVEVGSAFLSGDADLRSYGVFGGVRRGPVRIEGWVGTSDAEDLLLDADILDYGLSGSYAATPEFDLFATYLGTRIDGSGEEVSGTTFALGAEFAVGEGTAIYGAFGSTDVDLGIFGSDDTTDYTIGASYALDSGRSPVMLSAEFSRSEGAADADRVAVGLTFPFGGPNEPLNSATRTARGAYRTAVEGVLQSF
jgi:hypothetical protein